MRNAVTNFLSILELNESKVSTLLGAMVLVIAGFLFYSYYFETKNPHQSFPEVEFSDQNVITNLNDGALVSDSNAANQSGQIGGGTSVSKYKVESGDSLWKIAVKKYNDGYRWSEIAKVNKLKNPGLLAVGQELDLMENQNQAIVPEAPAKTEVARSGSASNVKPAAQSVLADVSGGSSVTNGVYTVVKNDSLWKIAEKQYKDGHAWVKIWEANKVKVGNPDIIFTGSQIAIP